MANQGLLRPLSLAVDQIRDPRIRKPLLISLGIAILVYMVLIGGAVGYLTNASLTTWSWLEWLLDAVLGLASVILASILFVPIMTVVMGFFLEEVADAVDAKHYPQNPPARSQPLRESIGNAILFGAVALGLNLLALPLYLTPLAPVVLIALNGYLVGREYFELVALRHRSRKDVRALHKKYRKRIWISGAVFTVLFTLPLINLIAPLLAAAAMVHVHQDVAAPEPAS